MDDKIIAAMVGGLAGGVLGVVGTVISTYFGPRMLEEWKERKKAERLDNPRKELLKKLLSGPTHQLRSIKTLSRVSGTSAEECRRLLIEIDARGIRLSGNREG